MTVLLWNTIWKHYGLKVQCISWLIFTRWTKSKFCDDWSINLYQKPAGYNVVMSILRSWYLFGDSDWWYYNRFHPQSNLKTVLIISHFHQCVWNIRFFKTNFSMMMVWSLKLRVSMNIYLFHQSSQNSRRYSYAQFVVRLSFLAILYKIFCSLIYTKFRPNDFHFLNQKHVWHALSS